MRRIGDRGRWPGLGLPRGTRSDGLVLPIIIPLRCDRSSMIARLTAVFVTGVVAARAEVWVDGRRIMILDAPAMEKLCTQKSEDGTSRTFH